MAKLTIKSQLKRLNDTLKERAKHKPSSKRYRSLNGKVHATRLWLRNHNAEPGVQQTEAQPVLTGFFSAVENPRLVDLIQREIVSLATKGDIEGITELVNILKKAQ